MLLVDIKSMNNKPTILVIFGISGDLAKRYLLPAIGAIAKATMLPEYFHIVGITRQPDIDIDSLLKKATNTEFLKDHISLQQIDIANIDDYKKLGEYLKDLPVKMGWEKYVDVTPQYLFYLSVPPQVSRSIIEFLGTSGLSNIGEEAKLLLEKPFGVNLENATDLAHHIDQYFLPNEVYRVDHYIAKETAQNIIVFRDGNSLFKRTWNKNFIKSIEIIASEEIGIEGRANFYEQTGALRDIVQSHLLQLLSLILMKLPDDEKLGEVPGLRLEALKHLKITNIKEGAKRGQYEGYTDEVNNPDSFVETFVSIILESTDERWTGVPITLTTGKALKNKSTLIKILYKKEKDHESNELFLQLQPKEEIQFNMWAKRPGYEHKVSPHNLSFKYKEHYDVLPEAYEQVLFNAINSDHSLFTTSDEVLEAWRILDELQKQWEKNGDGLIIYKKRSTIEEIFR
jgi:glucose-6-phosphate 1-dehydrogenase